MVQMTSRATPKRSGTSRRRVPRNRKTGRRFGRNSRKATPVSARSSFRKAAKIPRLCVLLAWLGAVAALAGLLYWGKVSKPAPKTRPEVAARDHGASPGKAFDHRGPPKSRETTTRPTENVDRRQSTASAERHSSEPQTPINTKQTPETDSHETHVGNHYASRLPDPSSNEPSKLIPPQPPPPVLTPPVARVAIVIDDFGQDLDIAARFLELPIPITFSVLPYQQYTQEVAELAHAHHHQVILHLPMEPHGYPRVAPGKGALLLSMSGDEIQKSVSNALDVSPYFAGVNNHMGSRFTENPASMKAVLEEVQKRKLYFIDSYTSPRSVASSVAQQVHVPFRRRDIFLDTNPSEEAIRAQIRQVMRRAKIQGSAVAIGHPHESTLRALSHEVEAFKREKIAVVPANELMPGS
jgi:polysaccharide deacetylase 2 family uncharacterized protein YibQ